MLYLITLLILFHFKFVGISPFFSEFSVKLFAENRFDTVITLETNPIQSDDAADSIQPSTLANYVFFSV